MGFLPWRDLLTLLPPPSAVFLFSWQGLLPNWICSITSRCSISMTESLLPDSMTEGVRFAFLQKDSARLMGTKRTFKRRGQSGMWFFDLLPHLATRADDLCMIQSMHTDQFNHHPGQLMMQCGQAQFGLPSMGSWVSYGLGSENQDLPSYVVLTSGRGSSGGSTLWNHGFLPSIHGGVLFRNQGTPILNSDRPSGWSKEMDRHLLDALDEINRHHWENKQDPEIISRIANYEMAFRMQMAAPELVDLSREPDHVRTAYGGIGQSRKSVLEGWVAVIILLHLRPIAFWQGAWLSEGFVS